MADFALSPDGSELAAGDSGASAAIGPRPVLADHAGRSHAAILIADDDARSREALRDPLEGPGQTVVAVESGLQRETTGKGAPLPSPAAPSLVSVKLDAELLDLIPRYIENRGKDIDTVDAALERGDFDLISSIGHNLRGSGCSFGLDELSAIGIELEHAAKATDRAEILRLVKRIRDYLPRIDIAEAALCAAGVRSRPLAAAPAPVARGGADAADPTGLSPG